MKIKQVYLILLFFSYVKATSQTIEFGQILSRESNKPVSFATIFFKKNNIGIHSNQEGIFEFSPTIIKDTIVIRTLGYKTLTSTYEKGKNQTVFYLEEEPIPLPTITIKKTKNIQQIWKGATINESKIIFGQMGSTEFREVALYIPNDEKKDGYLREVGFYIARFGKHKTPFRIHFYESENNMPKQELLNQNLIFHAKRPNDYYVIDVSKLNIPFSENGIFISMEWLNLNDKKYFYEVSYPKTKTKRVFYGQQIGLTNEFEDSRGRRRISSGEWKLMNGFSAPMIKAKIDFYND